MEIRIGYGYDVHRLVEGRPCILGGVEIPHEKGLAGHSDADVLLHAITDALLGALALGDIGTHFPDTDPQWKGADSRELLRHVVEKVEALGWGVINMDATVIAEEPKLRPWSARIRESVAGLLKVTTDRVSVKASTNEKIGFVGRGEGIAAHVTLLLTTTL